LEQFDNTGNGDYGDWLIGAAGYPQVQDSGYNGGPPYAWSGGTDCTQCHYWNLASPVENTPELGTVELFGCAISFRILLLCTMSTQYGN